MIIPENLLVPPVLKGVLAYAKLGSNSSGNFVNDLLMAKTSSQRQALAPLYGKFYKKAWRTNVPSQDTNRYSFEWGSAVAFLFDPTIASSKLGWTPNAMEALRNSAAS